MDDGDDGLQHWIARGVNFTATLAGVWMATGRFMPAAVLAVLSTVMATIGYGWGMLQIFGVAALFYGVLRVFDALPF